jgi:hypothetical protein
MQSRLDVGGVIRRVFDIYVDQAPVLMPAAAVVFVFSGIIFGVLVEAGPAATLLGELIALVAVTVFTGMVVELVADVRDGRRDASVRQLLAATSPVIGKLLVVGVVVGAGVLVGFFLLLVPGLILLTLWSVAAPAVVIERPPGLRALGRSRELVAGNGLRVFAVIVLLVILFTLVTGALSFAAESASTALGIVVRVVLGVLAAPLASLAQAVLYFELRDIKAGAEPPLTRVPDVEPQPPHPPGATD